MTVNKEDYIKAIYELGGGGRIVSNKAISKALGVSAPSVSEMIGKLVKDGYVDYISYHGVILIDKGMDLAIKIKKRHLLWEVFLVEKLGYDWEEVHEDAEVLEHVTSDRLEMALDKFLEYPKHCPHGSPIISSREEYREYITLGDAYYGKAYRIIRFEDDNDTLNFIKSIGLKAGKEFKLIDELDDKSRVISSEDKEFKISNEYINKIYIEVID